ncbi:MAG: class I SAM-dependent methyltransferase, partial [Dehalococcoidia bacterium]
MEANNAAWEQLADWFDGRQGDEGDFWHRTLINPTVLRVLGSLGGQRVLDLACGNGALARQLARRGAMVTGVDVSAALIAKAEEREKSTNLEIVYYVASADHLTPLGDGSFDTVVCNMALMDIVNAEDAIREAHRILRPGGHFVASITHPCFELGSASAWVVEKLGRTTTVWRKVTRYRENFEDFSEWNVGPGLTLTTPHYHRPLSWYFRAFHAAGFVVTALEEPEPT